MRLWHYKLIPFLPNSQLIAQWRELNSIFKKQDKHILINYVYEYPKANLFFYSKMVIDEMRRRKMLIKSFANMAFYFNEDLYAMKRQIDTLPNYINPFPNHHDYRYLLQCFYNLQEKYDRGQKDFDTHRYADLEHYIEKLKLAGVL